MIQIFADGGSRGNPGHAAYGFVVKKDGKTLKESGGYIGIGTNNFAEYTAVIEALRYLSHNFKGESLEFSLDSLLVVQQANGIYKVKNANIRQLMFKIRELEADFKTVSFKHIPRERNHEADKQVNLALDKHIYGVH